MSNVTPFKTPFSVFCDAYKKELEKSKANGQLEDYKIHSMDPRTKVINVSIKPVRAAEFLNLPFRFKPNETELL